MIIMILGHFNSRYICWMIIEYIMRMHIYYVKIDSSGLASIFNCNQSQKR